MTDKELLELANEFGMDQESIEGLLRIGYQQEIGI